MDLLNLLRKPGEEIRKERKRKGLTQSTLARRARVSQALIARIEKNQVDPRLSTLRKIAEALMENAQPRGSRAIDIAIKDVIVVNDDDTIEKALKLMRKYGISQLPVLKNGTPIGAVEELELLKAFAREKDVQKFYQKKVVEAISSIYPMVDPDTSITEVIDYLLKGHNAVLVTREGRLEGIITKIDVLMRSK
ncbi:MAG: CBS domain-containing protein, partial [Crenarchaeota archaeon]|nr:CBS domain-containing protein [Thermoproteota archaeon]MDW8034235.1 CBS domain-containing protein [Nitrososphaerota archaeon]